MATATALFDQKLTPWLRKLSTKRQRTGMPEPQVLVISEPLGLEYSFGNRELPFH